MTERVKENIFRVSAAIFTGFFAVFIVAIASFFALLIGGERFMYTAIGVGAALYILFILRLFHLVKGKKLAYTAAGLMTAVALTIGSMAAYDAYLVSITNSAEVDLTVYEPFESGTKAVSMTQEASLHLEEPLPELDGATALYPLYSAFVQAVYPEDDYPHVGNSNQTVMATKTDEAYSRLIAEETDMIFVAGPSERQELAAKHAGFEFELTPIGREAFVFFVNTKNPVDSLTVEEIQGIYSGEITNWKEVGGEDEEIQAFQRPDDSGSQTALEKLMVGIPIMEAPAEEIVTGMGGIIKETSDYRNHGNAIGFSYRFFSTEMVRDGDIKLIAIDGVHPSAESIRDDSYPLSAEFYAITVGERTENEQKLIDWILSEEGQWIVEETGYVNVE
ncbi:PstS family phosphate ABC transporter substrate-binding protein [Jeotgalibacillus haloalkalitolerans]|uniref:Substrate-binding domain-containing protein n=1 Tax=Jeotgalibacillus haloalkalitolerans TaxID=3104292 RepID=A0ABU5KIM6_9BACL|nr:substrate-binding domain-containing protein [Jeotgalibacillus sp. HH7-29]MDZ5710983.1 substrate-binding domain-containing protein [Jeotgalibacillus sp. HH7-29]